jgi:hypothetical protein
MKRFAAELRSLGAGCIAMTVAAGANAAEMKVMASAAFKEAYGELVPAFEKASGHTVTTVWAGTNEVVERIAGGETVDLVIIARPGQAPRQRPGRRGEIRHRRRRPRRCAQDRHQLGRGAQDGAARRQVDRLPRGRAVSIWPACCRNGASPIS